MKADFGKAYEVLGVKPGVSPRELKVAHRDLAKVWHPDRFLHDPRLQEKAQEKLKEINEAYEQLISGRQPKPAQPPSYQRAQTPHQAASGRGRTTTRRSRGYGFALLTFMAVFALTISTLLQRRAAAPEIEIPAEHAEQATIDSPASSPNKKRKRSNSSENSEPLVTSVLPPVERLATVTVVIDPRTGLLATPDCPLQTRMTYPSGGQPHGYCNAPHAPKLPPIASEREPQKESAIKSFSKRIGL